MAQWCCEASLLNHCGPENKSSGSNVSRLLGYGTYCRAGPPWLPSVGIVFAKTRGRRFLNPGQPRAATEGRPYSTFQA